MITVTEYAHQNIGVFGLGKAGDATIASLLAGKARLFASDDSEAGCARTQEKYAGKIKVLPVAQWPWTTMKALVLSPGVPLTHPKPHEVVEWANRHHCPVIGDIELLFRACPQARYIGITGTNGKSTTTTLIGHILETAGLGVEVGGNLGTAALSLNPLAAQGTYVLELSSYQLDLLKTARFSIAAFLNVTPDHLDRHGSMEGYVAAKKHIFERQQATDTAIVAVDDEYTRAVADELKRKKIQRVIEVSTQSSVQGGVYVENGLLHDQLEPVAHHYDLKTIVTLTGRHNWQNAALAYAVARACGILPDTIYRAMQGFAGLRHRLQLVATINGVRFINDSKATNADAASYALAPYDVIYWIAGGKPKAGGIASLSTYFPKIAHAFLIGDAEQEFADTLTGKVAFTRCGTLKEAVRQAAEKAFMEGKKNAVVLLSPACASFDQWKSFEERGDAFCTMVEALAGASSGISAMRFDRTDTTLFGRWWWTVDRLNLFALLLLIAIGSILVTAGSPPVAKRLDLPEFYFVHRHQMFLLLGLAMMILVSLLPSVAIRRLAVVGFSASVILMVLVLFMGVQTKGAHRWIDIAGISIQPSEFMKPCFAIVMAWVCAENHRRVDFPGYRVAIGLYLMVVMLLVLQPDIGMTLTVTCMWSIQLFLSGLPFLWVFVMIGLGIAGVFGAYYVFPHVAKRINNFLDPTAGDNYQIGRSLEAFRNGGILGRGPGEGEIKQFIPDSHTDFIFAVAGEEFGVIVCLFILSLFAFVVLRGLNRVREENDLFVVLAVAGVLVQFGIQSVINMGVAVNLFPAKGMTLPFLSYGGSSVIAIALGMGMMLALTRRRYGQHR